MPNLEPSYLRYVHDQLASSVISPENAAGLPNGFIGLYEKEFQQKISINERQNLLRYLATWALFKGPVSAKLASNILKVSEEEVKDFIDRYSSWFNSPESGIYQLYHERLRVYLLQKLNDKEIHTLNEQIISYLEKALNRGDGSEDEKYALQFLHNHMALESMLGIDYERLHNYVNQESLWERQIKISKSYEWSQNAVQHGIKEGARRSHEMNTIRSTVNSVKLMTQEQNSAEAIIELLNEGDYHSALKRAESWEGDRQFKLYLLFIHELTIGTSKEADFRKVACKSVLEAIDQTPEDHSVLDWTKFYPELAIYKYYEQLLKMNLDGMVIWRRGDFSILNLIDYCDVDLELLMPLIDSHPDEELRSWWFMKDFEAKLDKGGFDSLELEIIRVIESFKRLEIVTKTWVVEKVYLSACNSLFRLGCYSKAIEIAEAITDKVIQLKALLLLSDRFIEVDERRTTKTLTAIIQADVNNVKNILDRENILIHLAQNLVRIGRVEEAIECVKGFREYERHLAFEKIAYLLVSKGFEIQAFQFIQSFESQTYQDSCRGYLAISLFKIGKRDKSLSLISLIDYPDNIIYAIGELMIENQEYYECQELLQDLTHNGNKAVLYAKLAMSYKMLGDDDKYIRLLQRVNNCIDKAGQVGDESLATISQVFAKYKEGQLALDTALQVLDSREKSRILITLSNSFIRKGLPEFAQKATSILQEVVNEVSYQPDKDKCLGEVALLHTLLNQLGRIGETISSVSNKTKREEINCKVIRLIVEAENFEKAFQQQITTLETRSIIDRSSMRYSDFLNIADALLEKGYLDISLSVVKEIADDVSDEWLNSLIDIAKYLIRNNEFDKSFEIVAELQHIWGKNKWNSSQNHGRIYSELVVAMIQDNYITSALELSNRINDAHYYSYSLYTVLVSLVNAKSISDAVLLIPQITSVKWRTKGVLFIAKHYFTINDVESFNDSINNALNLISQIKKDSTYFKSIEEFASMLITVNRLEDAFSLLELITDESAKAESLLRLSFYLNTHGFNDTSQLYLSRAVDIGEEIEDDFDRYSWYEFYSKFMMKKGEISESLEFASKIPEDDGYDFLKSSLYLELVKLLVDSGKFESAVDLVSKIPEDELEERDNAYGYISKSLFARGKIKESAELLKSINRGSGQLAVMRESGISTNKNDVNKVFKKLDNPNYRFSFLEGISSQIGGQSLSLSEHSDLLFNYSSSVNLLQNVLFSVAKEACFFELERNEEKLDMLSEVLDIEDWRRISSSFNNN